MSEEFADDHQRAGREHDAPQHDGRESLEPEHTVANRPEPHEPGNGDSHAVEPDTLEPETAALDSAPTPALQLSGLGVRGSKGWAFRDVDLQARPGDVVAITGPSGSGRSALLLTIAGRMRPSTGSIEVLGVDLAGGGRRGGGLRQIRRKVALARLADQVGLDEDLTVGENTSDAADWAACPRPQVQDALDQWRSNTGLRLDARTPVGELPALEATALHLLLAAVTGAEVIALDDADANLTPQEREVFWRIAADVAAAGAVVIATGTEAPLARIQLQLHRHESSSHAAVGPNEPGPEASAAGAATAASAVAPTPDDPQENGPQR